MTLTWWKVFRLFVLSCFILFFAGTKAIFKMDTEKERMKEKEKPDSCSIKQQNK